MASRRNILISTSVVLGLAALGAVIFVVARQGDGNQTLAQAPLNIETQVKPAFMMAVDDSGSMTFETLFPGQDGQAFFSSGSFFSAARTLRTSGGTGAYHHLIPHSGARYRIANRYAIPPFSAFGFARSPDYNPQYFDPNVTYMPWMNSDGSYYPQASIAATLVDPRDATPTINLFATREESGDNALNFRVLGSMVIPANTRYYKAANCGGLSGGNNQWVSNNANQTLNAGADCQIGISYYPATYYLEGAALPAGFKAANRVLISNACGTGCDLYKYEIASANYASAAAYQVAAQNFANWYSYYGNRNRSMIAGMTQSLSDINSMRIGYFRINQNASYDNPVGNAGERVAMRDMAVAADRDALYANLLALPASGGTPNRQAVNAAGMQFTRTDTGAPVQLSCQKNAVMLFTDGYSNGDGPTVGGVDNSMGAPFQDSNSDTMADIAAKYYLDASGGVSPLRTDLDAGNVPVPDACSLPNPDPRLDCQRNLHVSFYGVTLGARGNLYNPDVVQDAYTTASIYNNWPQRENDRPSTVDDIWHASVNTRGQYINASTPADITQAMRRILESVGSGSTPSGSIALTGSRVGADSLSVVPFYASTNNGTDWYSTLTAQAVTRNATTGAVAFTKTWEATEQLPGHAARNIRVAKTATGVNPAVSVFSDSTVTLANLCSNTAFARCTAATITGLGVNLAQAIAYLRGDQTQETAVTGTLRRRTKVLGDIVNSSPVVSAGTDDYGYRSLRGATAGTFNPYAYENYLTTKKTRVPMVYAAANDGMLHAFNGTTGVEQFAYIPATALGHMGNLLTPYSATASADQKFQHRYYVDGPISVSDAYLGAAWKTVLVGTAGAGGRGVFALDVSTPASFGNSSVLWELNDQVTNTTIKNNIGHVLGKPIIVPVKVGSAVEWKAIFGNGYGSINGKAVLFVVNLSDGVVTTVLADEANAALPSKNGLGNLIVLDRYVGSTTTKASDGYGDTVYAGDQNGAVWKFDLRSATPAAQSTPFYTAKDASGNRQSITGGFAAASGPGGGLVLYFGTGSFSFTGDTTDTSMQSLYGVQDRETTGYSVTGRAQLQQQKVLIDTTGDRTITTNGLAVATKGWYLDLGVSGSNANATAQGERSVGNPVVESGVVFFPTYQPTLSAGCSTTGINRVYGLNALSGSAALSQVRMGSLDATPTGSTTGALALNTGGSAPVKDLAVLTTARYPPLTCIPGSPGCTELPPPPGPGCSMVVQVAGAPPMYLPRPCGRQSWRQVR